VAVCCPDAKDDGKGKHQRDENFVVKWADRGIFLIHGSFPAFQSNVSSSV